VRERVKIAATTSAVWPWIADPERMRLWNDKLVSHSRTSDGELRAGETYWATLEMAGKTKQFEVTVEEVIPERRILLLYREPDVTGRREVRETLELSSSSGVTNVLRTIDLRRSGIPLFWRIVIEFIQWRGKPQGKPMLEVLRERVEPKEYPSP
jgi:uncharacterized protein YndB with AHSA1/START domain